MQHAITNDTLITLASQHYSASSLVISNYSIGMPLQVTFGKRAVTFIYLSLLNNLIYTYKTLAIFADDFASTMRVAI